MWFFNIKQVGGEVTDFIIVLRTNEAVRMFGGNVHFSIGAGLSAAVGIVGRAAGADLRAGDGGCAACYTYSCSKGMYCSVLSFRYWPGKCQVAQSVRAESYYLILIVHYMYKNIYLLNKLYSSFCKSIIKIINCISILHYSCGYFYKLI